MEFLSSTGTITMHESTVSNHVRDAAARQRVPLWRNNVGACEAVDGRQIRYGLCNESAKMNKEIKSSDLIGITPLLITPAHYGMILGVFTAVETKRTGWHQTAGDTHAAAQANFHRIVRENGGFAGFATCPEDLAAIIGRSV